MRTLFRIVLLPVVLAAVIAIGASQSAAQYEWQDTSRVVPADTTVPQITDTLESRVDTLPPRRRLLDIFYSEEEEAKSEEEELSAPPSIPAAERAEVGVAGSVVQEAHTWLRRMLFRGALDATHIGGYAQYQLTAWDRATGAYGPVQARLTIYYLGSTVWQGRDAEWLQAVYETMDEEPSMVEFDLTVPTTSRIEDVYRVLYRVDRGELKTSDLSVPANQLDYDKSDRPIRAGQEEVRLYSGTYPAEVWRGSGSNGAEVTIFRTQDLPPVGIVVLGYGSQALTLVRGGSDAAPRFHVPPPPSR